MIIVRFMLFKSEDVYKIIIPVSRLVRDKIIRFEQAYDLYKFDSVLRKLICPELKKGISIHTHLSHILIGHSDSEVFWFANPANDRANALETI